MRRHIMWCLIWVCALWRCPIYGTLGLNGLNKFHSSDVNSLTGHLYECQRHSSAVGRVIIRRLIFWIICIGCQSKWTRSLLRYCRVHLYAFLVKASDRCILRRQQLSNDKFSIRRHIFWIICIGCQSKWTHCLLRYCRVHLYAFIVKASDRCILRRQQLSNDKFSRK